LWHRTDSREHGREKRGIEPVCKGPPLLGGGTKAAALLRGFRKTAGGKTVVFVVDGILKSADRERYYFD